MGTLNAKKRNAMKKTSFALPAQRAYPIPDLTHAKVALARAAANASPKQQKKIRAAVVKKFPSLKKGK